MRTYLVSMLIYSLVLVDASLPNRPKFNRVRAILDKTSSDISYDELHRLAVLDQIESYIEPVKWLETRNFKTLNGLYDFCFDPEGAGFTQGWTSRSLVDSCREGNYHKMPVPAAFNEILSNKTAKNYMGWMWYQTTFMWERQAFDKIDLMDEWNWLLQIDSINYLALVWMHYEIRGREETHFIGSHVGGHLPITLNVSSVMTRNLYEANQIRLTFAVSNRLTPETIPSGQMVNLTREVGRPHFKFQPDFDFFHYAGIMGEVRLIRMPMHYLDKVEVMPTNDKNTFRLMVCLNAEPHHYNDLKIKNLATSEHGPSLYLRDQRTTSDDLCQGLTEDLCNRCFHYDLHDGNAQNSTLGASLQWPYKPKSIRARIHLHRSSHMTPTNQDDSIVIKLTLPANMSKILSDTTRQLQGFGMHHEQMFSGRTMSLASIMKDLYLVKSMGANVLRTSHYPYSTAYLDACDELGLMVIAECPAVGLKSFSSSKLQLHAQMVREMMMRDDHHPSIVMWSLANEPESQLTEARDYFGKLTAAVRAITRGSRPLTAAIAQSHAADKIGDFFDVLMINRYYGWYDCTGEVDCVSHSLKESLAGWAGKYGSDKPLMISEFGADTVAGLHSTTSEIFTEEFQRDLIVEYERVFDELVSNRSSNHINLIGSMVWNFADFSTHESLLRVGGNKKGVFTGSRGPKLAAESLREIYKARMKQVAR